MAEPLFDEQLSQRWELLTGPLARQAWRRSDDERIFTVLELALRNLRALKDALEGEQGPSVSWESPWIEAQYPIGWDWKWHGEIFSPASEPDTAHLGSWQWHLERSLGFCVFHFLTHGVAFLRRAGAYLPLLPPQVRAELEATPEEDRREYLDMHLRGFWFSDPLFMRFEGRVGKHRYDVAAVLEIHPLVLDEDGRRAYHPVVTGLRFTAGDPHTWTPRERRIFWTRILKQTAAHVDRLRPQAPEPLYKSTDTPPLLEMEPEPTVLETLPEPVILPRRTFPLPMGPALVDRETHEVLTATVHTRGLFRNWSELPVLNEEVRKEAERIYREEGLEGLKQRKGGLRQAPDGTDEPYLAVDSRTVKDLMLALGMRSGYRRLDESTRDVLASGGAREYACRVFRSPQGYVEIGLSWDSLAGPWMDEWHVELERRVALREQEIQQLKTQADESLFPEVQQAEIRRLQQVVDQASAQIRIWKRGHAVMGLVMGQVFHQRSNWVVIPADAIRMALWDVEGSDPPQNWKQEVDNVLASLATVTFSVRGLDGETLRGFGRFVGEVWYEDHPILVRRGDESNPPAPPQSVGRNQYLMDVQPGFVGCLQVFRSGASELDGPAQKTIFDWAKPLSQQERGRLKGSGTDRSASERAGSYVSFDPARILAHGARDFSTTQRALDDTLEREITLNWITPPGRRRQRVLNAQGGTERLYSSDDCPLLTDGQLYVLAGGNGRRAGSGYTVGGRRSVLRRAGWLEMVGGYGAERSDPKQRSQAARRFLDDLEIVVEEYYGGVVAGYDQGQWISLDAIRELGVQEIMNLNVRPFLPADYRERRRQTIRERGIEVHDTPEELHRAISRQVTVSAERIRFARRDRRLSQQALADLLGVHQTMISQIETGKRPVPEELRDAIERWLAGG